MMTTTTMRAQDWRYMGEGGKHAVFGYERPRTSRIKEVEQEQADDECWTGCVLRIRKQDIACSVLFVFQATNTQEYCSHGVETVESRSLINDDETTDDDLSLFYIRHVVAPSLTPYVDVPRTVRLDWEFLNQLRRQCLEEEEDATGCSMIPEKRRADWSYEAYGHLPLPPRPFVIAVLLPDYRRPSLTLSCHDDDNKSDAYQHLTCCCSIEIKPKAGYLANSPLVSPNHRVKYSTSRFQLLQKLYAKGKHSRAWMNDAASSSVSNTAKEKKSHNGQQHTGSTTCCISSNSSSTHHTGGGGSIMSAYDPLDLFSGETERMHKAIESLMACPQNCLKMWMGGDGELRVSSSSFSSTSQQAQYAKSQSPTIKSPCDRHDIDGSGGDGHDNSRTGLDGASIFSCTSPEFLAHALTTILHEEDLLKKLVQLQRLDILDGDGAILVYKRLLELFGDCCGGCCEESTCELVERCIDSVSVQSLTTTTTTTTTTEQLPPHPLLGASPFRLQCSSTSRIHSFCSEVEVVQRVPRQPGTVDDVMVTSALDEAHCRATQIVHSMDKEELQYLLQLWLLSLAMCDVSFFVILRELPPCCTDEITKDENVVGATNNNDTTSIDTSFRVEELQSEGKPGILSFVLQRDTSGSSTRRRRLAYELKAIDCDQKPARKLRSRYKKEDLFDFFVNEKEFNSPEVSSSSP